MPGNTFGTVFRITTFGESHGDGIGVIIDGCPAGLRIDSAVIHRDLQRRRPGQSAITTSRKEPENFRILSGVFEGLSLGTPIAIFIPNSDQKSKDYGHLEKSFRPSHADYTYQEKYGIRDHRGGGRSSARETAARVAAGAIARQFLKVSHGIEINAWVSTVKDVEMNKLPAEINLESRWENPVRCPEPEAAAAMEKLIKETKKAGDSVGGIITCLIRNCPPGLGEPVFDKLHADLGKAMLSINAVKGFEYGSGFGSASMHGSAHNDLFYKEEAQIKTKTNHSGGIQGGISNGMEIMFRTAFKPVATIMKTQSSVDDLGNEISLEAKGRHDPCVVPRAVPIVEAMAALVLADHLLRSRLSKLYYK